MAVDTGLIGTGLPPVTMVIERGRLRFFAKAIGEEDPVYTDLGAANRAGHRDLPVPPTFLFGIELEAPNPFGFLAECGVDLRRILHGEQSFDYRAMAYAGDTLVARPRVVDVFTKKGGALEFVVKRTEVVRADEGPVADLTSVLIVRDS